MEEASVRIANQQMKDALESWSRQHGIDAVTVLSASLEARLDINAFEVVRVTAREQFIVLEVRADSWERSREFGVDGDGRVLW